MCLKNGEKIYFSPSTKHFYTAIGKLKGVKQLLNDTQNFYHMRFITHAHSTINLGVKTTKLSGKSDVLLIWMEGKSLETRTEI